MEPLKEILKVIAIAIGLLLAGFCLRCAVDLALRGDLRAQNPPVSYLKQ